MIQLTDTNYAKARMLSTDIYNRLVAIHQAFLKMKLQHGNEKPELTEMLIYLKETEAKLIELTALIK